MRVVAWLALAMLAGCTAPASELTAPADTARFAPYSEKGTIQLGAGFAPPTDGPCARGFVVGEGAGWGGHAHEYPAPENATFIGVSAKGSAPTTARLTLCAWSLRDDAVEATGELPLEVALPFTAAIAYAALYVAADEPHAFARLDYELTFTPAP